MFVILRVHSLHTVQATEVTHPPACKGSKMPGPHTSSGLDRATGLGGPRPQTIAKDGGAGGRESHSISSRGVPLELRAKVFCDFSLWYLTDHLPKICESSHSKAETVL